MMKLFLIVVAAIGIITAQVTEIPEETNEVAGESQKGQGKPGAFPQVSENIAFLKKEVASIYDICPYVY